MQTDSPSAPLRYDKADLDQAVACLQSGGVLLYPTDTIWGLGCDATNEEAVQRIFQIKQRSDSKSMLVLTDAPGKLQGYVDVPDMAWDLMEVSERPITIIYPNARNVAPSLIAEDGTLGIRVTSDAFCQALCRKLRRPIVSTSANISGHPAPAFFSQIDSALRQQADYVCRYRRQDHRPSQPSSVVKLGLNNEISIIRP